MRLVHILTAGLLSKVLHSVPTSSSSIEAQDKPCFNTLGADVYLGSGAYKYLLQIPPDGRQYDLVQSQELGCLDLTGKLLTHI